MIDQIHYLAIDSAALGIDVWAIDKQVSGNGFAEVHNHLKETGKPYYVFCKIPADEVSNIQTAQRAGFEYVETQLATRIRMTQMFDTSRYPYIYSQVVTSDDLLTVIEIASSTITHDRFSRDLNVGQHKSGLRYAKYIEDSYHRESDEIWCTRSRTTGEILTFRSHRHVHETEVSLLLGGVSPKYKDVGLGVISSHYCFNQLRRAGYKRATTHISAANIPIMNLEVGHLGFRITETFVILRAFST